MHIFLFMLYVHYHSGVVYVVEYQYKTLYNCYEQGLFPPLTELLTFCMCMPLQILSSEILLHGCTTFSEAI